MLKTITRFTSSFAALLTNQDTTIDLNARVEDIRSALLDALMELGAAPVLNSKPTWTAIARASEAQTLW